MLQVAPDSLGPFRGWFVVATVVASLLIVVGLVDEDSPVRERVRRRFLHGVPWGTFLTCGFVLAVYLFVQGGLAHPKQPLVIPFRSWSYFYPLGMVAAAFSHSTLGHVTGNLVGTLAFAPVVEYVWGHYPTRRGSQTFSSLRSNPYARILAVPVVSIAVGLFTALFALGPVVGFSGVVFAYAGFAIVSRPVLSVFALLGVRVLSLVVTAVQNPFSRAVAQSRVVTPWWTNVAIQGHGIGIIAGILLGIALVRRRDQWPSPGRLWFAAVAFAAVEGLWAVYLPAGNGVFFLFRWIGAALVFVLGTLVTVAAAKSGRALVPGAPVGRRLTAGTVLVLALVVLSAPAVAYNVAPVGQQPSPRSAVEVGDYSVAYAEDVENGYAAAVDVPFGEDSTSIEASGVIVTSESRYVWILAVQAATLRQSGRTSVLVGGLDWRQRVYVNRTGWNVVGNDSVYKVFLRPDGEARTLGFTADPSTARPVVAGRNVTLRPATDAFEVVVSREGRTVGTAPVPANGSVTTAGGLTFERADERVYAVRNRTRVPIASRINS